MGLRTAEVGRPKEGVQRRRAGWGCGRTARDGAETERHTEIERNRDTERKRERGARAGGRKEERERGRLWR